MSNSTPDYIIQTASSFDDLQDMVNKAIDEEQYLVYGPMVVMNGTVAQALVLSRSVIADAAAKRE